MCRSLTPEKKIRKKKKGKLNEYVGDDLNISSRFLKHFPEKHSLHRAVSLTEWEWLPVNIYISSIWWEDGAAGSTPLVPSLSCSPFSSLLLPAALPSPGSCSPFLGAAQASQRGNGVKTLAPKSSSPAPTPGASAWFSPCVKGLVRGSSLLSLSP